MQIRIGLFNVKAISPEIKTLGDNVGAWLTILCYCENERSFIEKASQRLAEIGLMIVDFEDIELLSERLKEYEIDDELLTSSKSMNNDNQVIFGKFHCYPSEG